MSSATTITTYVLLGLGVAAILGVTLLPAFLSKGKCGARKKDQDKNEG